MENATYSSLSTAGQPAREGEPVVFVVDDDEAVRKGLERLLTSASYRVETFPSAEEFLRRERHEGPACLVLDVFLTGLNGLDLQRVLAPADCCLPIVFITGHGDVPMSVEAMKAGAVDFLAKPFSDEDLFRALEDGLAESRKERRERAKLASVKQRLRRLSLREYEVLCHVVKGEINRQIAEDLGITERTVKEHRHRIVQKMQVRSLPELVRLMESPGIAQFKPTCTAAQEG